MKSKGLRFCLLMLSAWMHHAIQATCESTDVCTKTCNVDCAQSNPTFLYRSFSSYSFHDLIQMKYAQSRHDVDHKLSFTFYTDYMQNFGSKCKSGCKNLGARPFWSGDNTLTIGNNNGKAQFDAYYMCMGDVAVNDDGIAGKIQLDPRVQHVGTDMMMYYVHKKDERSLYVRVHAPLVAMKVTPHLTELIKTQPSEDLSFHQTTAAGLAVTYENVLYPTPARRPESVVEYFFGGEYKEVLKGNISKPIRLRRGRIPGKDFTIIRLADLTTSLGYNVFANEKGFVGLGFKASCPTGNLPTADYMLEPIVGRAGAWGLGGELSAKYQVWSNENGNRHLTVSTQGEVMHLMPGRTPTYRAFDLKLNGKGSKYMFVQRYTAGYSQTASNTTANSQTYVPGDVDIALHITTLPVVSKIAVEGSLAMMFDFVCDNWNASIGGEFWGRSSEKLSIDMVAAVDQRIPHINDYAVIGRQLSAYRIPIIAPVTSVTPNPMLTYICEPAATINAPQSTALLVSTAGAITAPLYTDTLKDARLPENRIPGKLTDALDICGAQAAHAFTGKIFGQVGYTWTQYWHQPSLAIVGGAEFTNKTNNALQVWNVGLQGTVNF